MTVDNPAFVVEAAAPPLQKDKDGVVRVAGTRVTLDTIVTAFREGATAEEVAHRYPTLSLADVYSVIGYYLQRQEGVEAYLRQRQEQREETRRQNESRFDPQGIRDRLLARRASDGP